MNSQLYRFAAVAYGCAVLALWPVSTPESSTPVPAANLHIDDVRAALAQIGYVVAEPVGSWDGHVRMVEARAPTGAEMVRVLVFPDTDAAAAAHRQAQSFDDASAYSDDVGPQLLSGYGASAWRRNVALIQTSPPTFGLLMPPEIDCFTGGAVATGVPFSEFTVDRAALDAIQSFHPGA